MGDTWPRTVMVVHNRYRQPGGEDGVFEAEAALLERQGHRVVRHETHNDDLAGLGPLTLAARTVWNREQAHAIRRTIEAESVDLVHFHNTFPLISPGAHWAAAAAGAAVVQTLHNYRLICPAGTLYRDGRPCEDCVGSVPWPGVVHRCYHDSLPRSGVLAGMLTTHRLLGTWHKRVHAFIALTAFARDRFRAGGLPVERMAVKPNFVEPDPGAGAHTGGYFLFVGRLVQEKGIATLLEAWRRLDQPPPLRIVGDGPMAAQVERITAETEAVEWLGARPRAEVLRMMHEAYALVAPSTWYEGVPLTLLEAFATGLPVVTSRIGGLTEIVEDGRTGLQVAPGDADALAEAVRKLWQDDAATRRLGMDARATFERNYTADRNYRVLSDTYLAAGRAAGHLKAPA